MVDDACVFAEVIKTKGLEKITVEELVAEITPRGRGMCVVTICIFSAFAKIAA